MKYNLFFENSNKWLINIEGKYKFVGCTSSVFIIQYINHALIKS